MLYISNPSSSVGGCKASAIPLFTFWYRFSIATLISSIQSSMGVSQNTVSTRYLYLWLYEEYFHDWGCNVFIPDHRLTRQQTLTKLLIVDGPSSAALSGVHHNYIASLVSHRTDYNPLVRRLFRIHVLFPDPIPTIMYSGLSFIASQIDPIFKFESV